MKYIWFVIFTLSALTAFGQKSARVRQLEEQRKKALAEVEMTNQLLQETTQTAQNTLNRLNLLSQQILSRKKVISLLNQELGELDNQIAASRREISKLEKELDGKRENYGKSMQSMYKRRSSQDKLLFILSADNFALSRQIADLIRAAPQICGQLLQTVILMVKCELDVLVRQCAVDVCVDESFAFARGLCIAINHRTLPPVLRTKPQ